MGRRLVGLLGATAVAGALLSYTPQGAPGFGRPAYVVVENDSVLLPPDLRVNLGTPVGDLPPEFSLEAYDPAARSGLVQWRGPSGAPVLLLVVDGTVRAISVAYEPGFRTSRGVELGDPESVLRRTYGSRLQEGDALTREFLLAPGFALGDAASSVTYFDTSCTGRVNAIALALGAEGLRALGRLWQPPDPEDPCAPV